MSEDPVDNVPDPSQSVVVPVSSTERAVGIASPSNLIAEVLTEIQESAPTDPALPTDATPLTEAQDVPDVLPEAD